jgi:hypothetical protein
VNSPLEKIIAFLNGTRVTVLWFVVAFIAQTLITFLLNEYQASNHRMRDAVVEQNRSLIENLHTTSRELEIFVGAFVSKLRDSARDKDASRDDLVQNLRRQFAAAEELKAVVFPDAELKISAYQRDIQIVLDRLPVSNEPTQLAEFWSATSDLVHSRDAVLKSINIANVR